MDLIRLATDKAPPTADRNEVTHFYKANQQLKTPPVPTNQTNRFLDGDIFNENGTKLKRDKTSHR